MKLTRLFFSLATISLALHAQPTPAQPRLLCMFFDLNSLDAAAQSTARDNAIQFVQQQATPSDRIAVMTYTSQLNVLQDFTDSRDGVLAALQMVGSSAAAVPTPGPAGIAIGIQAAETQLAAIQAAISVLAPLPEKKAMIYFSSGVPRNGFDNQAELRATTDAAVRANVAIYSVDSRGLVVVPR